MANPNIVNVTSIAGTTTGLDLTDTSATVLLTNGVGTGEVFKVNMISACNEAIDSKPDSFLNTGAAGGGTAFKITDNLAITADTSLMVVDRASGLYVQEGHSLVATASRVTPSIWFALMKSSLMIDLRQRALGVLTNGN